MSESDLKLAIARSSASLRGVDLVGFMETNLILVFLAMLGDLVLAQVDLATSIRAMTIHRRIKELRENLGLSMEALATIVGVTWQTVQQWENGKTAPSRKRIPEVAGALNTTQEYLLFGDLPNQGKEQTGRQGSSDVRGSPEGAHAAVPLRYSVGSKNFRRVYVIGRAQGGLPERIWTDGDYLVGVTDEYAEIATTDPYAFLIPVVGTSMIPRFNPGEFALVEPGTDPELEDDVLVRLATGETMIKQLKSRRGGIQLGSYNESGLMLYQPEDITWMYYIAHPVPARKIKIRM